MGFPLTGTTPEEKLKELTDKLEQGVREIFTSGRYAEYLAAISKFHSYSYGNVKDGNNTESHKLHQRPLPKWLAVCI